MFAATHASAAFAARRRVVFFHVALLLTLMSPPALRAQEGIPEDGLFITVQNPITSDVVNRIKAKTNRALQRNDRRIRAIIYDFNPDKHPACTKDYGPCHDLARFLLEQQQINTIAFVHNELTGHTVLPVLACREIVMSAEARLGEVLRDQGQALGKGEMHFYEEVAHGRSRCPALVLKMFDKEMEVLEATRMGAVWYIDRRNEASEAQNGIIVTRREPVLVAGSAALYTPTQAQKFALCNLIKESRQDVASAYQLSPTSLREDPLDGRTPIARLIEVRGQVNKALAETLRRKVRRMIGQRANLIILQLECGGGDTQVARDLADFLRTLKDDKGEQPVMTVAFIPERAPDAATFVALGCTEIVMGRNAEMGDFDSVVYERRGPKRIEVDPAKYQMKRDSLVGLAEEQGYPPLIARGMLDKDVTIYRVQSLRGASEWRLITGDELRAERLKGQPKWGNEFLIKPGEPNGQFLKLNAIRAKELGIARELVDGGLAEVITLYGIERLPAAGPDWLDEFASALRHPVMAVLLVMIGIACLILELKMPGVGLPGVLAAICFVLYFWAHSQLAGQITMLAVLLFVLGLILVGIEIFVLPGFGITGISGIVLILLSLALVTLEKKPETSQEWLSFGKTIGTFGLGVAGAMALALTLAWYLPHIPYANRLVLKPQGEDNENVEDDLAQGVSGLGTVPASLLGAIGVAVTTMRPAGIARFGEDFVDVVAEGSYVPAGNRVQVIEIEGNRVVVKEV